MEQTGVLDEALERLHKTGPEFAGWLSNHGPMAIDALIRLGGASAVNAWVSGYCQQLVELPPVADGLVEADWREALGQPNRLGDWLGLFARLVRTEPWDEVLVRWWPRLLPGAVASATHGLIRTGHAVRSLRDQVTGPRVAELGQAFGYWAARWQPLTDVRTPKGNLTLAAALDSFPTFEVDEHWGIRPRLEALGQIRGWGPSLAALAPTSSAENASAFLDALTDAAVTRYATHASGDPVMLIHSATAPRAAALVLPSLPVDQYLPTLEMAWVVSAAITAIYPSKRHEKTRDEESSMSDVIRAAIENHDEHVLKFTEVAIESHHRGNRSALPSALLAARLVQPGWAVS